MRPLQQQPFGSQPAPSRYHTAGFSRRRYVAGPFMAAWGWLPQPASRSVLRSRRTPLLFSCCLIPFSLRLSTDNLCCSNSARERLLERGRFVPEPRAQILSLWQKLDPVPPGDESPGYVVGASLFLAWIGPCGRVGGIVVSAFPPA